MMHFSKHDAMLRRICHVAIIFFILFQSWYSYILCRPSLHVHDRS
jgi:hypothetical protein